MAKFNLTVEDFFWTSESEPTVVKQDRSEMLQTYVHQINTERDMSKTYTNITKQDNVLDSA